MRKTKLAVASEKLSVLIVGGETPSALFLHGAGQSNKERALPVAEKLAEHHISSVLFDFSGHGESTGKLERSSLAKRVDEADAVFQLLDLTKPITLFGFSMGGHIALELLDRHPEIANLVLFYPGIYTPEAYSVNFTSDFSNIIRQPESWRKSTAVKNLDTFTGHVLIIIGDKDEVIPTGVIELIEESSQKTAGCEVVTVRNGPHYLLPTLYADKRKFKEIIDKIASYSLIYDRRH